MIQNYTFETMYNANTQQKDVVFTFESFPEYKFTYKNIRFGEQDADKMVPVLFDLEFISDLATLDEDFEEQTRLLLMQLLKEANDKATAILESNKTKSDVRRDDWG